MKPRPLHRSPIRSSRAGAIGRVGRIAPPRGQKPQRGAALLMAMVTVTLVATLAAGMVWQQWRAVQVEAAERSRAQSSWVLVGALDWARLILREDGRAGNFDHLGEPWATPLAEARLSTFLAADRENNADTGPEAFLSGTIQDAQARYNLRNVLDASGKIQKAEVAALARLCAAAKLPVETATRLSEALARSWGVGSAVAASAPDRTAPLPVRRFEQLAWLGFEPATLEALRPHVDILPSATPINVNTASRDVLAAVLGIDLASAERLTQVRQRAPFDNPAKVLAQLPADTQLAPQRATVSSIYFYASGRLRLDERVLEESSLVLRRGTAGSTEVVTVHRERRTLHIGAP